MAEGLHDLLESVYRSEKRQVLATLIRLLGGFDAAEDALHEAFAAAAAQWPRDGVPRNPRAWLVSAGRFSAIDGWRRNARIESLDAMADPDALCNAMADPAPAWHEREAIEDDVLRLIFVCCHPSLPDDARTALTLREVCGLTTEEIARAYLTGASTIAQRIVRAKAKIRDDAIAYEVPALAELPPRLDSALRAIYLIFNEGYAATQGPSLTRADLSDEAIRLGRLMVGLLPDAEALGLLALMLLHESRRATRTDAQGDLVLLEDQDRALWNRALVGEAQQLLSRAMRSGRIGPYSLQAAIAAEHARARSADATNWGQVVALYDVLSQVDASPVVALNRAVALGMRDGFAAGLAAVERVLAEGGLQDYHLAHAARADLQRRLALDGAARASYQRALELTGQPAERRFLQARLDRLSQGTDCA
ncbi:MAG: RNA polymerase sigma factor [Comamonadaceae bacterium]|nr:MAG: RNA polymerase sigma factor [Comamonadaceae bacterium]